jgi:hypothetical protein
MSEPIVFSEVYDELGEDGFIEWCEQRNLNSRELLELIMVEKGIWPEGDVVTIEPED